MAPTEFIVTPYIINSYGLDIFYSRMLVLRSAGGSWISDLLFKVKENSVIDSCVLEEDEGSLMLNGNEDSHSDVSQNDPRHCDCCYCEVFGHGLVSYSGTLKTISVISVMKE